MHPFLFQGQIASVPINFPTFTIFILGALAAAVIMLLILRPDVRTKPAAFVIFLGTVFLCAAMGAKTGQFIIELISSQSSGRPWYLIAFTAGSTVTTGFLSGLAAVFIYARFDPHRIVTWPVLDALAIAIPLAHGIGRIGCLFNGCCYGDLCSGDFPFAITYPENWLPRLLSPELPLGPRYPAPLIEALGLFLISGFLLLIFRTTKTRGQIVPFYLIGYGFLRFFQEFLRGDEVRGIFLGYSTGQWFGFILITLGILMAVRYAIAYSKGTAQPPFLTLNGKEPGIGDAFTTKETK